MRIRIVPSADIPGTTTISDVQKTYRIDPAEEYVLSFTSGGTTLRAFRELFLLGKDAVFHVANLEHFVYKMRQFRHCEFVFADGAESVDMRAEEYRRIETKLCGRWTERGVELSFRPDVFASIRTSLARPDLYLSEDCLSAAIYRALDRKMRYEELRDAVSGDTAQDFDRCLKSLLFTGVVRARDNLFSRW